MLVEPRRGEFGRRQVEFAPQSFANQERIIVPRWKMALLLLGSLIFVGIFFSIPLSEWTPTCWLGAAIFGLGVPVFSIGLVKPASLDLDAEGFTYAGGLMRTQRIAWRDIERFFVWKPPRGAQMVGYTYVEGRRPTSLTAKLNRLVGMDGGLPSIFPLKAELLAEKLEGYRRRAR